MPGAYEREIAVLWASAGRTDGLPSASAEETRLDRLREMDDLRKRRGGRYLLHEVLFAPVRVAVWRVTLTASVGIASKG